ncbi:MAG TPA: adenylate/guanylate cyclase domain-containing protein [Candidatus Cybelea sp.]
MSDIVDWLRSLSLERYAGAFQRAEVELDTLAELTESDLKDLGLPLGPRRKILAALHNATPSRAERRHVTVLFADLVGSTEIASKIDPEAMGSLLANYQRVASQEIERYGGYVAKFLGDGIMAYFGWPRAQEDAAERSLRAGLAVTSAVSRINVPGVSAIQTRVGIATGNVVIGNLTGSAAAKEDTIAGATPNLAARLQAAAQPDEVVISDDTHRLVGALFDCRSSGPIALKGYSDPITAWSVQREASEINRFAAVRAMRAGLVGRNEELNLLLDGWNKAIAGRGSAFVISGEGGIGKSRLVEALRGAHASAAYNIRLQCSAFHATSALFPVGRYIEQAAGFLSDDSPSTKRRRLNDLFSGVRDSETLVPLVSEMLSLKEPSTDLGLTPAQRKAALIGGLAMWIAELSASRPVLLVLEDAHWSDATTLEWLTRLIESVATLPQQIVVTARPNFTSPWIDRPQVTHITLDRLYGADCERIVTAILNEPLPDHRTIEQIVQKSDGNPLFLEELAIGATAAGASGSVVPDTLQDALMARLDQLGGGKAVAQQAAVLGRRFTRRLLGLILSLPQSVLDAELSNLVAAGVLYPIGRPGAGSYEFKHALMRDAAYESLLLADRRRLHGDVAALLERNFPELVGNEPELLAYHYTETEDAPRAAFYHERTGDRAVARFAYVEAIASFRAALAQVERFAPDVAKDRAELALSLKLGTALSIMLGQNHPDAGAAYERAVPIARAIGDERTLFQAVWGLWIHSNVRGLDTAPTLAEELVKLSERSGNEDHLLEAIHSRWSTALFRGEVGLAVSDAERGMKLYDATRHHHLAALFGGHDPGVCAYVAGGTTVALHGYPVQGGLWAQKGVELADSLEHPHSIAHGLLNAALACACTRDIEPLRRYTPRLIAVAEKFNFLPHAAVGNFLLQIYGDGASENLDKIEPDYLRARALSPLPIPLAAFMAERLIGAGHANEALDVIASMIAELKNPHIGLYLSELHRVRAEALHVLEREDAARTEGNEALRIARTQGAGLLVLRTQCTRVVLGEPAAQRELADCVAAWPADEGCLDLTAAKSLIK